MEQFIKDINNLLETVGVVDDIDTVNKEIRQVVAKSFVPKNTFNSKLKEIETLENELKGRDKELEELQESNDSEELKDKLDKLKAENERLAEESKTTIANLKKSSIAEKYLTSKGARDVDVIMKLIDIDEFDLDEENNSIQGLEDKVKELQENHTYLFETEDPQKKQGNFKGLKITDKGADNPTELSFAEKLAKKKAEQNKNTKSLIEQKFNM